MDKRVEYPYVVRTYYPSGEKIEEYRTAEEARAAILRHRTNGVAVAYKEPASPAELEMLGKLGVEPGKHVRGIGLTFGNTDLMEQMKEERKHMRNTEDEQQK